MPKMPTNDAHAMMPPTVDETETNSPVHETSPTDITKSIYGHCDGLFTWQDYDIPTLSLCVVLLVAGVIYCFAGYRFNKAVMFVTGLLFGSTTVYLVCAAESVMSQALGNAAIALGAGVLFGLITMLVDYVGLFLTGFLCGLHIGVVLLASANFILLEPVQSIWIHIGLLFLSGVCMALLTLRWCRVCLIVSTVGGIMACASFVGILGIWGEIT